MIILIILVYIDNMAIAEENTLDIINFKRNLFKNFNVMNLDKIHYILNI